ncbi:MAG: hypothetical protein COA78_36445 [Blastopirellula sp.]|nr:MAG: hypothetical protein COA78_36445 [Blastopirellula sp.]
MSRLDQLVNSCSKRGGDCPCDFACEARELIRDEIDSLRIKKTIALSNLESEFREAFDTIEKQEKRLGTLHPQLKPEVKIEPPEGYQAIVFFDSDEAYFQYEDADGQTIDQPWPFTSEYVYPADVQRLGLDFEHI